MSDIRRKLAEFFRDDDDREDMELPWADDYRIADALLDKFDVTEKVEPVYAIRWHYSGNITDTGAPIEDIRALKARYPDDLDIVVKVGDDWESAE